MSRTPRCGRAGRSGDAWANFRPGCRVNCYYNFRGRQYGAVIGRGQCAESWQAARVRCRRMITRIGQHNLSLAIGSLLSYSL